ncbi:GntR family transcriptional regulator [Bordetella sp. FB-8]|uniref:GntR family transcriptional regulator n=1 Tax=Bordetella sp. FB-8 TaxID=1159870 RepID=UPI0003723DC3|nr:GntR family transcriptional regulator [Bordetella sp. FB-8]
MNSTATLADALREEILSGQLLPGSLLSQTEIASRFGVSRIPVRDALQQLAAQRLVLVLPGKGARVIELTKDELAQLYDLRVLLECDLLRRSIEKAGPRDHAEVEYALRKSSLEAGRPGWGDGDWLFHAALYAPAGRARQLAMVQELRRNCVVHAARYDTLAERTAAWLDQHEGLFQSFRNGRIEEAVRRLERHIDAARVFLMDSLG